MLNYQNFYEDILNGTKIISVLGLGYVGLPIAISFSKKARIIGFDIDTTKIDLYKNGIDLTKEVGNTVISSCTVDFTSDENKLQAARFHIITVPTPVDSNNVPDLTMIINASSILGRNLKKGSIAVYESTVYPGVTEEICIPILEQISGLKCGTDFKVGYSPERINPGDKTHSLNNIVKVVSGMDAETLEIVAKVYGLVVEAGVYRAESIKVAEAAKVIENSQRDINIAFMNELSIIFNRMGIDTKEVLEAAGTKWNFLRFSPGLVGGHCIGIDPYYLAHKAKQVGYDAQIILSGRRINDSMGKYVAENTVKKMIQANKSIKGADVAILGITFKENCPDCRNTKVIDIINELGEYGVNVQVFDPVADYGMVKKEYGICLRELDDINNMDAIVIAVAHQEFVELGLHQIKDYYRKDSNHSFYRQVTMTLKNDREKTKNVLIDVKGIFDKKEAEKLDYLYWRL